MCCSLNCNHKSHILNYIQFLAIHNVSIRSIREDVLGREVITCHLLYRVEYQSEQNVVQWWFNEKGEERACGLYMFNFGRCQTIVNTKKVDTIITIVTKLQIRKLNKWNSDVISFNFIR